MARQLGALRDALTDAGANPVKADMAAEELAGHENRLGSIDLKLERLTGDIRVVQAIGGIIVALLAGVLRRLLSHRAPKAHSRRQSVGWASAHHVHDERGYSGLKPTLRLRQILQE